MTGILILLFIALAIALILHFNSNDLPGQDKLVARVDSLLPQTQCGKCGYPGCKPYAEAIVKNHVDINQCPPGGKNTIRQLASLLGREIKPLNPAHGKSGPKMIAFIDEDICIGCVKCIKACPVDAIVGAPKQMHTVITRECTGCELCVAPCPVDCISMLVFVQGGRRVKLEPTLRMSS